MAIIKPLDGNDIKKQKGKTKILILKIFLKKPKENYNLAQIKKILLEKEYLSIDRKAIHRHLTDLVNKNILNLQSKKLFNLKKQTPSLFLRICETAFSYKNQEIINFFLSISSEIYVQKPNFYILIKTIFWELSNTHYHDLFIVDEKDVKTKEDIYLFAKGLLDQYINQFENINNSCYFSQRDFAKQTTTEICNLLEHAGIKKEIINKLLDDLCSNWSDEIKNRNLKKISIPKEIPDSLKQYLDWLFNDFLYYPIKHPSELAELEEIDQLIGLREGIINFAWKNSFFSSRNNNIKILIHTFQYMDSYIFTELTKKGILAKFKSKKYFVNTSQ